MRRGAHTVSRGRKWSVGRWSVEFHLALGGCEFHPEITAWSGKLCTGSAFVAVK